MRSLLPAMLYKQTKTIPEKLSVISFGCWGISGSAVWNGSNDADSIRAVHRAIDAGINLFDVAPVYGFGHAEAVLGEALAGKRDQAFLATKCGFVWDAGITNVRKCLKKQSVIQEIEASLRRLRTDRVDLYQLHWPDHAVPIEETMEAVAQLLAAGKIRYVGLTNFPIELAERAGRSVTIASQQGLYNLLERNATYYYDHTLEYRTEKEILPYVREKGQAFFAYSPLLQGLLTGSFARAENYDPNDIRNKNPKLNGSLFARYYEAAQRLKKIADEIGVPLNQVALRWLIQKEEVTSVITGALDEKQLGSNLAALEGQLSAEVLARIAEVIRDFETD